MMRRLVAVCAVVGAWLAADGLYDEVHTRLRDVCRRQEDAVVCSCSTQHPVIDVVAADTVFLSNTTVLTIENCPKVKLAPYSLEMAVGLEELSLLDVSRLDLSAVLPITLKDLVLSRIGKLEPIPGHVFQVPRNMNALIMEDVTFEGVEPYFLDEVKMNFTEITGCSFPSLSSDSLYINSQQVVIQSNNFSSLDAGALVLKSENATLSNNSFETLVNGSIQWHHWPDRFDCEMSFQKNTIHSLELSALTGLLATVNSTISDNVLLCSAEEFKHCKEKAQSSVLAVCVAENVCPYRHRTELTEMLAKAWGCDAGCPPSPDECAVLLVRGAGHLQTASSVAVAAALLVVTWFAA